MYFRRILPFPHSSFDSLFVTLINFHWNVLNQFVLTTQKRNMDSAAWKAKLPSNIWNLKEAPQINHFSVFSNEGSLPWIWVKQSSSDFASSADCRISSPVVADVSQCVNAGPVASETPMAVLYSCRPWVPSQNLSNLGHLDEAWEYTFLKIPRWSLVFVTTWVEPFSAWR